VALNGQPIFGPEVARNLSMGDRREIISALDDHTPGPRLGEVTKACGACGNEVPTPLSLAALFRV
jgi:hypothetical protein